MNETENNNLVTRANLISETDVVMGTISARNDVDCFNMAIPVMAKVHPILWYLIQVISSMSSTEKNGTD